MEPQIVVGRVTQVIPPDKHGDYMIGHLFRKLIEGKYLVVVVPLDMPRHFGLQRIRWGWKHRHERIWTDLVMDNCFYHEGQEVRITVKSFTPVIASLDADDMIFSVVS